MSRLTQRPAVGAFDIFTQLFSADPASQTSSYGPSSTSGTGTLDPNACTYIGQQFDTSDGRTFVAVQNGTSAIAAGLLVQAPVQNTAFHDLSITVPTAYPASVGATQIYVTNGSTKLNLNQFQQGYVTVITGTGAGQTFKIGSHQAAAASASFVLTLDGGDSIQVALDTTSKVSLNYNNYDGVVVSNHSTVGLPVGVTYGALTASTAPTFDSTSGALTTAGVAQYGLIVRHGLTGVLIDTLTEVGYPVGPSTNTDGAVNVATLTTSPQIGISAQTQVSGDYGLVYLTL